MLAPIARASVFGIALTISAAYGQTLSLPEGIIDFRSEAGESLLEESDSKEAYSPLASNFLTQKNQAYCGVASIVMVLNALSLPARAVPEFEPYLTFTQDNVLDEHTDAILPRSVLMKRGMTLDQLGALLELHPLKVEVHHAGDSSVEAFREKAKRALAADDHFVIVNYLRVAIGQERGGHISPLAAYDSDADMFLILDVARYKYPPAWVAATDLFAAMNTTDADNDNRTRGFVLVSRATTH
jgi:hypothetical protein